MRERGLAATQMNLISAIKPVSLDVIQTVADEDLADQC